jgi:hypothetical protein
MGTLAIFIYATIDAISTGSYDSELLITMTFAPATFSGFMFVFDKIFDMIFPNKLKTKRKDSDKYGNFLDIVNKAVENDTSFSIEDYRRLRDSDKFQKALRQAFKIYEEGESQDITFSYLEKKFKKSSREYAAMNIVLNQVKKLKENS